MQDFSKLKDTPIDHDLTPEESAKIRARFERVEWQPGTTVVQFVPKAPTRKPPEA
jgi:hypothetical protein